MNPRTLINALVGSALLVAFCVGVYALVAVL